VDDGGGALTATGLICGSCGTHCSSTGKFCNECGEPMIAELLTVIPHTQSMVLITSRPEYHGALTRVHGAQTIALAPLDDSDTAALLGELASRR
jgi:predicted amidophosphoribosyltransferase